MNSDIKGVIVLACKIEHMRDMHACYIHVYVSELHNAWKCACFHKFGPIQTKIIYACSIFRGLD